MANDPLVSADWLKSTLGAPDLRVVDATWFAPWTNRKPTARETYAAGHVPGAVFFDIDEVADTNSPLPHMLPDPVKFSSRARRLGLGDGSRIVVYDRNRFFASARVWWMLRAMGHRDVVVLDGGWDAWTAAGGEAEDLPPAVSERHFTARIQGDLIKDADQVAKALAAGVAVLDARSASRFNGEAPEPRPELPSGHMPGSRNTPAETLIDADGCLADAAALKNAFAAAGAEPGGAVIATCGSGVSAAVVALALARLGNDRVAIYDGSWSDWASQPGRPIATGPA